MMLLICLNALTVVCIVISMVMNQISRKEFIRIIESQRETIQVLLRRKR